jgi:hypothetical protein
VNAQPPRKPRTILWIQLFIGLVGALTVPVALRFAASPLSVFASAATRFQVFLMVLRAVFIPLGALWVIVALQLRRRRARFSATSVLVIILVTTSMALPHAVARARAVGDPKVVLPRTIGGALVPFLAACLLGALAFERPVRDYLGTTTTDPESGRP